MSIASVMPEVAPKAPAPRPASELAAGDTVLHCGYEARLLSVVPQDNGSVWLCWVRLDGDDDQRGETHDRFVPATHPIYFVSAA